MSQEFKKNHEVPRCLLNRWSDASGARVGVWVFVIPKQRIDLSNAQGGTAFSFAITKNLYVPVVEGVRQTEAEQWFSRSEGIFDKLLRRAEQGVRDPITVDELIHFIRALLSMHYRSAYEVQQILATLRWRPDVCEKLGISVSTIEDARRRAVENCVNAIEMQMRALLPYPILDVITDISDDLLICDRPILEIDANEFWMPLGPRTHVMIRMGSPDNWGCFVNSAPPGKGRRFVQQMNDLTVNRARRWVVGASRTQLEAVAPLLTTAGVDRRQEEDQLGILPREHADWWSLRRTPKR